MPTSAVPRGKTLDFLLKDETNYGVAATGNYAKTFIYDHGIEEKRPFEPDPLLGLALNNNRDQTAPAPGLPTLEGAITVPLDFNHIGHWLKGAFGAATVTGSADPWTHVWQSGGEVLPHRTLEAKLASAVFMQYTGVIVNRIGATIRRAGGFQQMTVDVMGRKETKLTSSAGGTPTLSARAEVTNVMGVLKINGAVAAAIMEASFTYDNKVTPQDFLGDTLGYALGHDLDNESTFEGSVRLRFLDATIYDLVVSEATVTAEFLWAPSVSRSLSFLANVGRFDRSGVPVRGPGAIECNFNFRAEQSSGAAMLTTTLKSAVQSF